MIARLIRLTWCAIFGGCVHSYTKWDSPRSFGYTMYQDRECTKCGKRQQRSYGYERD